MRNVVRNVEVAVGRIVGHGVGIISDGYVADYLVPVDGVDAVRSVSGEVDVSVGLIVRHASYWASKRNVPDNLVRRAVENGEGIQLPRAVYVSVGGIKE